jgi:multidrug transporter EmrE-like cation transporter
MPGLNKFWSALFVLVWVVVAFYADVLFKRAATLGSWSFIAGCSIYTCTSVFAFYSYRLQQWGWIGLVWSSLSVMATLLSSVFLFGEPFTMQRRIAAILALAAILLTE